MKKFLFIVCLFSLFLYINQERTAFAEIENVQAKEQIDNNTSNETEFQSSLSNPELLYQKPKLRLISPYYIMSGDSFSDWYPFLGGTDENGNEIDFSKIVVRKYTPNRWGYCYLFGEGDGLESIVEIYTSGRDSRKVQLKNITLWQNDRWDLGRVIETVTDKDGYSIKPEEIEHVWIDGKKGVREIDTSKPGEQHEVRVGVSNPQTRPLVEDVCVVTVREDKTKAELKDDELYVGEKWDLGRVLKNVTDGTGSPINPEKIDYVWIDGKNGVREIDTSKPGVHKVFIGIKTPLGKLITSEIVTVTVKKEDKTSLKTKDSTLYTGQKWEPKDNFVSATDEDGKAVSWEDTRIIKNSTNIDTSKPGVHKIKYTFKGKVKNVDSEFTVTVKEDKTSLKTKDSTLYTGQKWEPKDNFVSATDEDGKAVSWEDTRIIKNSTNIDTSKPGVHKIKYTFKGKVKNVDSEFTVTVKEDKTSLKLNYGICYIYKGEQWDPKRGLNKATDADGNILSIDELEHWWGGNGPIDPNKVGDKKSYFYRVYRKNGTNIYNNVDVQVKENKSSIKTKDSTLYTGQKWEPKDNFVSATDEDGKAVSWEDTRIIKNSTNIDTSKPGVHKIKYTFKGKVKNVDSEFTVTVKEDKTSLKTKDSTLYTGQKWEPKDNFVSATDEDGKAVSWEDTRIIKNSTNIDTSKPGVHKIKYTFKGKVKNVDSEFTVTVKEDQTKAELKDDELYVGQKWDLGRVFKNVVDKDGNSLTPDQVKFVWIDWIASKEIDTSKPGKHTVSLAIPNAKNEWVYSNQVTVTVKEEPFIIKKVPQFDFDDYILGSTNKSVANNKETPIIELETPSIVGKDWQLQVELSPFVDKKNEKNVLKGVSLFIPKGKLESDLETEEPSQYECKLEANGKASILMNGTKAKGKGRWKNKLETKEITLSIPSENKIGAFESTLHWTLLDVPT